ncbi:hypothetical protein DXC92_12380 [Clostridiales bacterium TF09-2AC]|uniref:hypothetical protein n=1 Tax=Enterocloster hominis (ex Hitch et al. 2024) TaxID=1917870 RepID=UPI000E71882B|nr:hypothetical protein [Lachnoclostridium pacaense]RJW44239.1 hypothetical protein DXC92_12380 [Clostridiales bacterium TF09-2AC]
MKQEDTSRLFEPAFRDGENKNAGTDKRKGKKLNRAGFKSVCPVAFGIFERLKMEYGFQPV